MLGFPILLLKGMRIMMFRSSGFLKGSIRGSYEGSHTVGFLSQSRSEISAGSIRGSSWG